MTAPKPAQDDAARAAAAKPLPGSRTELLALHREARRRRDRAPLDSEERAQAMIEIGRIEVEIARIERAMTPPLV